jgi:hypothetical protein
MKMQVAAYSVINAIRASMSDAGGSSIEPTSTQLQSRFYRMDAQAAQDVARLLPQLIEPGSWIGDMTPGTGRMSDSAVGTIHTLAAGRMLLHVDSGTLTEVPQPFKPEAGAAAKLPDAAPTEANVVVVPQAVLIITHKSAVQRKIKELLNSLLSENASWNGAGGDKVKFIAPGFQEGKWPGWNAPLGTPSAAPTPMGMGFWGAVGGVEGGAGGGFGGGPGGGGFDGGPGGGGFGGGTLGGGDFSTP